jgi:hypothetical protein
MDCNEMSGHSHAHAHAHAHSHSHAHDCCGNVLAKPTGRRDFVKIATLGAGVAMFGSFIPASARASGSIEALLLTCMDYRLVDATVAWMDGLEHMKGEFDHIVLAGASLGVVTDKFPPWAQTFWDHLKISIDLHHIKEVMILDHRDCGAYKVVYGKDLGKLPEEETEVHATNLKKMRELVKARYPELPVIVGLMALDGKVEIIG